MDETRKLEIRQMMRFVPRGEWVTASELVVHYGAYAALHFGGPKPSPLAQATRVGIALAKAVPVIPELDVDQQHGRSHYRIRKAPDTG